MKQLNTAILFIISVIIPCISAAQREQDNWYFGRSGALNFPNGAGPVEKTDNGMQGWYASATMSDKTTGQLLFYTDGKTVYRKDHRIMEGGDSIVNGPNAHNSYITSTLIVPMPGSAVQYYIFTVLVSGELRYGIVDMTLQGGLGEVISANQLLTSYTGNKITAAKHGYTSDYWLITYHGSIGNDTFECYRISPTGIAAPVRTVMHHNPGVRRLGTMITNNAGTELVLTFFSDANAAVYVCPFNKNCGTVGQPVKLSIPPGCDYPYGAAFASLDKNLYVVFGYMTSQVVQYRGTNYANSSIVATTPDQNFNDLQLAPNGNIYVSTHENNIPSTRIDVIELPDMAAPTYRKEILRLKSEVYFEFPNFINDKSTPAPGNSPQITINAANTCIGDDTKFSYSAAFVPDSIRWDFGDTTTGADTSSLHSPVYKYKTKGSYTATIKWYLCGLEIIQIKKINIIEPAPISLGPDTSFCHNDSVTLWPGISGGTYLWSNGATTERIKTNIAGKYWVKVTNGSCGGSDTISVKQLPPILVELGGGYAICDDDNELVKLDAGKGHSHYKWTPTGDTTQWIIVDKTGDYYVVVEDFRGCKGDDGTRVNRLCDFDFHIPNSFTPNGDGLNDVFAPVFSDINNFSIEIYNRWGEQVFVSNHPAKGWDGSYKGKACAGDSYIWKIHFKGNQNKVLRNYNYKGAVTLIR